LWNIHLGFRGSDEGKLNGKKRKRQTKKPLQNSSLINCGGHGQVKDKQHMTATQSVVAKPIATKRKISMAALG